MTRDMLQKTRVFWHESGHFVAQQFNLQFFGGYGTKFLAIRKRYLPNQNTDYDGVTEPVKPPGYNDSDPIVNPASMVASAVYGCFFQCVKYGLQLRACLSVERDRVHGFHDLNKVQIAKARCLSDSASRDLVDKCIDRYFDEINSRPELKLLFEQEISDLISGEQEEFYINLDELRKRFAYFMEAHAEFYQRFVTDLAAIFAMPGK